jgi:Methyltransferase domain
MRPSTTPTYPPDSHKPGLIKRDQIKRTELTGAGHPRKALQYTVELLTPGGVVIISVPNFESWQRHRFGTAWFGLDVPRHRTHFTAKALTQIALDAGLEIVLTTTSTSAVGLPASLQYRAFGRCVFRDGFSFYVANAIAIALRPISALVDRIAGNGDYLHVVARRPITDAPAENG